RRLFAQLVTQLLREGKKDKALKALEYAEKVIPAATVPHDYQSGSKDLADAYFALGQKAKAEAIMDVMANKSLEYIIWYLSLNTRQLATSSENCLYHFYLLDEECKTLERNKSKLTANYTKKFNELYSIYSAKSGAIRQ
ncbi:MAG: hypothetical protein RSA92_05835, partial [Bacteroidaceae bacterium]